MMTVACNEVRMKADAACAGSVAPGDSPEGHTHGQKVLDTSRLLAQRHHQRRGQLLRGPLPSTDPT